MRRVLFGLLWFIVFWFGTLVLGGAVVGAIAGSRAAQMQSPSGSFREQFDKGYEAGHQAGRGAGEQFGRQYGTYVLIGALIITVTGTALGILPGTKRRKVISGESA